MKRSKKLFTNTTLILLFLAIIYYLGGFYLSKEQCILETIRGLYGTETEMVMELTNHNRTITLMTNVEEKTISIVGTKKIGFLYQTDSSFIGNTIDEEHTIDISGKYDNDVGMAIFIYRNDKSICRIELSLDSGNTIVFNEWQKDFTGCLIETTDWQNGTYKAYDSNGTLIEEVYY